MTSVVEEGVKEAEVNDNEDLASVATEKFNRHPRGYNRDTIGTIFGVLGALFMILDIGSDFLLANEYREASVSASGHGCYCREVEVGPVNGTEYHPLNWTEFPRRVLCTMYGPGDINLDRSFMWMTIGALSLGGFAQTVMATYLIRQENSFFSRLPRILKVVTFLLCPITMGPVAIVVHFIMRCARGISLEEMMKYKALVGTFKVVDIIFESLPQLFNNAVSLMVMPDTVELSDSYPIIPITRMISIATAIITITLTSADWITRKNREFFVSRKHHPSASFIGLLFWILLGLLFFFTGVVSVPETIQSIEHIAQGKEKNVFNVIEVWIYKYIVLTASAVSIVFFILLMTISCSKKVCCKGFKLYVSTLYLLALISLLGLFCLIVSTEGNVLFHYTFGFGCGHLLIGFLILLSPVFGATVFSLLARLLFFLWRKLTCFETGENFNEVGLLEEENDVKKELSEVIIKN